MQEFSDAVIEESLENALMLRRRAPGRTVSTLDMNCTLLFL
jgi:hypothetical protein